MRPPRRHYPRFARFLPRKGDFPPFREKFFEQRLILEEEAQYDLREIIVTKVRGACAAGRGAGCFVGVLCRVNAGMRLLRYP